MTAGAKLAAFAVVLAAVFGGALAVGAAVDPIGETDHPGMPHDTPDVGIPDMDPDHEDGH